MSLSAFVLFMLGALCELLLLAERALPPERAYRSPKAGWAGWLDTLIFYSPMRLLALLLAAAAGLLLGLFELVGWGGLLVYIDSPLVSILFVVLGIFILFAALAAAFFLPPINAQNLLLVQGVVLAAAWLNPAALPWLPAAWLVWGPLFVIAVLLAWQLAPRIVSPAGRQRALPAELKAALYFWYLLCALLATFQSGQAGLFTSSELSWVDALVFGSVLVFMLLHGLTAMRFFLIVSSLLVPRNRRLVARAMPRLFSDEPVPALRFALVTVAVAGLLLANRTFGWLDNVTALSIAMLAAVQLMNPPRFRPKQGVFQFIGGSRQPARQR